MLIEGLSEGRRLSAEAYEAARSIYQDRILIVIITGFAIFLTALILSGLYFPRNIDIGTNESLPFAVGFASAVAFVIIIWRVLASKTAPALGELRSWNERLDRALSREIAHEDPPLDETSSFELMMGSAKEIPKWMKIRKKGGMFRQPLTWLVIVFFGLSSIAMTASTVVRILNDDPSQALLGAAISISFLCLSVWVYLTWRRRQREEFEVTAKEWARRLEEIMKDMENYLRSV